MLKIKKAFTLAEMMVVMLIMSIILAAMAPVMTTRSKADSSSPWRYSPENLSDAFFGSGESQVAMIGQPNKLETDDPARLIINSSASLPVHLSFKRGDTILGRLQFSDTNVLLGSGNFDHINGGSNNISIGPNNLTQLTSGSSNIAIGDSALSSNTSGTSNIGIGTTLSSNTEGSNNVAVGDNALASANERWNVAVGSNAYQNGTGGSNTIIGGDSMSQGSGNNNVAVGTEALKEASGDGNIAIGARANSGANELTNTIAIGFSNSATGDRAISIGDGTASGAASVAIGNAFSTGHASIARYASIAIGGSVQSSDNSVSIGYNSEGISRAVAVGVGSGARADYAVAVGYQAISTNDNAIALGNNSRASDNDAIAIGNSVTASGESSIAIGSNEGTHTTQALADKALAIGDGAYATGENSIALGPLAEARGLNNIAIGTQACEGVTGSNKICIGHHSGPISNDGQKTDSVERIYIGSSGVFQPPQYTSNRGGAVSALTYNAPLEIHKSGQDSLIYMNGNLVVRGNIWFLARKYDKFGAIYQAYGSDYINTDPNVNHPHISSDRRLKYVGKEFTSGLDKIKQLKVFNYTFKKDETKTPHVGVIAQDLQKVFPDAVKKGTDGFLSIRFEDMFFAMINAIKELDLKYQAQEKRIDELEKRIEKLESKIK